MSRRDAAEAVDRRPLGRWWFALLAVMVLRPALGFGMGEAEDRFRIRPLPANTRLSQTRVAAFAQDGQGFLWIATQHGLDRYDGYRIRTFLHDAGDPRSVACSYVQALFRTRTGTIWVACDLSLDRYEPETETFTHFELKNPDGLIRPVVTMAEEADGRLLFGTAAGVFELGPKAFSPRYLPLRNPHGSVEGLPVKWIAQDGLARWWVMTAHSLLRVDPASGAVAETIALPNSPDAGAFHLDRWGNMWVIAGYGLSVADAQLRGLQGVTSFPGLGPTKAWAFRAMVEDADGDMWFGSENGGVVHLPHDGGPAEWFYRRPGAPNALPSDRVTNLYLDRSGDIWVGMHDTAPVAIERNRSRATVLSFQPHNFQPHNEGGLKSALATSVFEQADGQILVGTGGALQVFKENQGVFQDVYPSLAEKDVFDVRRDAAGRMWFATDKGIARFDERRNAWDWLLHGKDVFRFFTGRHGELWVLTREELFLYDGKSDSLTQYAGTSVGEGFYAIAEAPNGELWLGSTRGLMELNVPTRHIRAFPYADGSERGPSDPRVNSLLFSRRGDLWVGTQSGLDRYDPVHESFHRMAKVDELGGQIVSCVLEDDRERLWMSSNQGLLLFDPRTSAFAEGSGASGIPSMDLSGWGACSKAASGRFYFGGFGGVVGFVPEGADTAAPASDVVLTGLLVNGQRVNVEPNGILHGSISLTHGLTLRHFENDVSFELASFDFRDWKTTRYQYRLQGLDSEWRAMDAGQHTLAFSRLAPGSYTLQVREAARQGGHEVALRLTIEKPWWLRWWMGLFYFLAFCAVLKMAYDARLRRLRTMFSATTEARVRERTSLARDLHDTLLQDFQGLILRFAAIILKMPPDDARREELIAAVTDVERALIDGRDALQAIRSTPMRLSELAGAFRDAAHDLSFLSAARVEVVAEDRMLLDCEYDVQEIFKLGKEALRNALRHAKAETIQIWFTSDLSQFTLAVTDDGIGIPDSIATAQSVPGHWGLRGMRERAERLGGQLRFVARERGTRLVVTLPNQNMPLGRFQNRIARVKYRLRTMVYGEQAGLR